MTATPSLKPLHSLPCPSQWNPEPLNPHSELHKLPNPLSPVTFLASPPRPALCSIFQPPCLHRSSSNPPGVLSTRTSAHAVPLPGNLQNATWPTSSLLQFFAHIPSPLRRPSLTPLFKFVSPLLPCPPSFLVLSLPVDFSITSHSICFSQGCGTCSPGVTYSLGWLWMRSNTKS